MARLAGAGLCVAVVVWLGLAAWVVADLAGLREAALVSDEAPRLMGTLLLPLAVSWTLVLAWSMASTRKRFLAAVIAQGVSAGTLGALLVSFLAAPLLMRTGPPMAATDSLGTLLLLQMVPLFLAYPVVKALRPQTGVSVRGIAALASGFAVMSCAVLVTIAIWGPSRCGNPSGVAIGRLRSMISAQVAYQTASGGRYGTLECLVAPDTCLPDYPRTAPVFLDSSDLEPLLCGYRYALHTEEGTDPASGPAGLVAWAMTAVPLAPERLRTPGFCADGTGTIRLARDGRVPTPVGGRCSEDLDPLQ